MKFLLIAVNAKYIHSNPAVYSLKAYAGEAYADAVEIAEYTINNRMEDILADLHRRKPDVAAFSCYIWNWRLVRELAEELHKIRPGLPIWLGGPEVSFEPREILEELPMAAGIMTGEGEQTFLELLRYYQRWQPRTGDRAGLGEIRGIVYRDGEIVRTTGQRELTDINSIPFLYEDMDAFRNRIIYYESSRGCPFRCSYCLSSIDKRVRLRDIQKVKRELDFFLEHQVPQVKFIDRTFNCNREHAIEIWNHIQKNDNGVTNFHFEVAADILSEEETELLARMRPGLIQLEIGVQSANPETLAAINRCSDIRRLEQAVRRIREGRNIHIHLDLIAGLPKEDYDSFRRSFNTVYRLEPDQLQLGFLKLLKGSPMYEKAGSYGINYTSQPPYEVLYSDWMSYQEICRLKRVEEMVELYYNSGQFAHTLPILEKAFEDPFAMFEGLADHYEKEGFFISQPSRVYRYEALLSFARAVDGVHEELYKELLTYDVYLREKMKTRPGFAPAAERERSRIRAFYDSGRAGEELPAYKAFRPAQVARMTHAEVFTYPVWETAGEGFPSRLEEPVLVLFDYKERDPLTRQAGIRVV
ncbi:MAG: B12-binding domain-containing radical SAM protein [Kineothrix sp.]